MQMARATYQGLKKYMMPNRPFVITRSGYSGLQRYSSVWTGDNTATWEHLWIANIQCQRLAISGVSFAGSDVGGFIGEPDGELYTRWIQLAAFHTFFRTHSAGNETKFNQEPWSFGSKYEFIIKKFIHLRYQMLPYLYTAFWQHSTYGTPIIRPLSYIDQTDMETHHRMDEFGYGDHIIVVPVVTPHTNERTVYLPKGTWYHLWNNHEYSILDGSYIKLREVIFGYDFKIKKTSFIQKLNLSMVGRNLAILYRDISTRELGIDPEVGLGSGAAGVGFENFQIPTVRSFGINLKASF
jgi:alpha-glucosidase